MTDFGKGKTVNNVKATVLIENNRTDKLYGEWGLSIFIENSGRKVLLDTGASTLYADNAELLGVNLKEVHYAVLSHAHYDHGNGMESFFAANDTAKFYLQKSCRENCYSQKTYYKKYIGIPKGILRRFADRIEYVSGCHRLGEGLYLLSHTTLGLKEIGKRERLYVRHKNNFLYDDFSHEQSLVADTDDGLVIFNSCCHAGAHNIINEVQSAFPQKRILAIIGGFHLFRRSDEEIYAFAGKLKETGVEHVYTGHCTGDRALSILQSELGNRVKELKTGLEINI